jgi:hypothetical protein
MKEKSIIYVKKIFFFMIFTVYILNISCSRTEGHFVSYEEFIESNYFKGKWVPETVLPKTSYNIYIKNDLDVNKVWLSLYYKKNDSIVSVLKNSKTQKTESIQSLFKKYSSEYGKNKKYWDEPTLLFGKVDDNQYYSINKNKSIIYYLRTGY